MESRGLYTHRAGTERYRVTEDGGAHYISCAMPILADGDIIGAVGATAIVECEDEPHLHFELWVENECINSQKELALIIE